MASDIALRVSGIRKEFPGVVANDGVTFETGGVEAEMGDPVEVAEEDRIAQTLRERGRANRY